MAAQDWMHLPMPPGWAAEWDPSRNHYFFIDHSTKTTTWEDPRETFWKQQSMQMAAHSPYAGRAQQSHRTTSQAFEMTSMSNRQKVEEKAYHMTEPNNDDGSDSLTSSSEEDLNIQETRFLRADTEMADRLKKEFPSAEKAVISQMLVKHMNSELIVADALAEAGYARAISASEFKARLNRLNVEFPEAGNELISDILKSFHGNMHDTRKMLKELGVESRSTSPSRTQSPPRGNGMTVGDKSRLKDKLQREFDSCSHTVIQMSLEVCSYDEAKTRALLHQSVSYENCRQSRRSSTQQLDRREASHSRSDTPTGRSDTPTGRSDTPTGRSDIPTFGATVITSETANRCSTPAAMTSRSGSSTPHSEGLASYDGGDALRSASPARSTVTSPTSTLSTYSRQTRATKEPRRKQSPAVKVKQQYVSANRTVAKGPNPSLVLGPNRQNLRPAYIFASGADASLVRGPDPANHKGPTVTPRGHNPALTPQWHTEPTCREVVNGRNVCERVFDVFCQRHETPV